MDSILEDYVTEADLKKFEQAYNVSLKLGSKDNQAKFEYAWCLIRSRYAADIKKGVHLMEDLFNSGDENLKRDYLFYLAVGKTKLKEYSDANRYIKAFLNVEPNNRQAQELKKVINRNLTKEGLYGGAIVLGAVSVAAVIGAALLRK